LNKEEMSSHLAGPHMP